MQESLQTFTRAVFYFFPFTGNNTNSSSIGYIAAQGTVCPFIINKFRPSYGLAKRNYAILITPFDQCLTRWVRHIMVAHYGFEQRQPEIHSLPIQPSPLAPRHVWCRCLSCEMSLAARSEDGRLYSQAMKFRMAIYTVRSYAGVSALRIC